jgi:two-component system response regulator GlrR
LRVAAISDATVLVSGETGTGKELVARALHYLSDRATHPFVAINCGSLTDTLLEDELFGHERGAFTDAQHRRAGLIAQAAKGTLFLDEVDTLSPRGQVALLRMLQDKVYRPLGSEHEYCADVRFVTATNASLDDLVESNSFRADLYYRICVFVVSLPPLRERQEDVLELARHFLIKHATRDYPAPTLSAAAEAALMAYPWPGNVRELENSMIRAVRLCRAGLVDVDHLALPSRRGIDPFSTVSKTGTFQSLKTDTINRFERAYLQRLMQDTRGNVTRAAQIAGKDRRDLGKLLKKHGLARTFRSTG